MSDAFVEIPQPLYRQLTPKGDERTDLYRSDNAGIRWMFWSRLRLLARLIVHSGVKGACLDFGGGSGAFLPTLSSVFTQVDGIDLDTRLARGIVDSLSLHNVRIFETNVREPAAQQYDAIVAADVLEHFKELDMPIDAIIRRLKPDGMLFTSLPTETTLYEVIRFVMRKQKPADHYHTAYAVEARLRKAGFHRVLHTAIPVPLLAPLFLISAWKYGKS